MLKIYRLTTLILFFLFSMQLSAQSFYKEKQSRDNIVSFGVGPSISYIDNGGPYRSLEFEVRPSISASLTKRLTSRFDLRATAGTQWIAGGGNSSEAVMKKWAATNSSFTTNGSVYYFDVMPSFYVVPFGNHMNRSMFNLYGGLGLGVMQVNTEQTKSFSMEEVPTREKITVGYVPIRAAISYSLGPFSDIALEGTFLATFTDNLDGNVGFNRYGDHLLQGQLVYRRYFFSKFDK